MSGALMASAASEEVGVMQLACHELRLPAPAGGYGLSGGRRYTELASTVVKVTATDGTCGYGEASTMGGDYLDGFLAGTQATVHELAPVVLACDPLQALPLVRAMDRALRGQHPGKAAIDMAMWDLRGRLLGVPVAVLLGGIAQTDLPAFAAVSVGDVRATADAAEALWHAGHRHLQVKVGDDPASDARRVHAVLDVIGSPDYLSLDANRGWTTGQALRFARAVAEVDCWLEQPCGSLAELARVSAATSHPLVLDEGAVTSRDVIEAAARGCADAVNIKPVRVGGLTNAARMRDVATAAGLQMTIDEPMGGALASAGVAHLGASVDPERLLAVSYLGEHGAADGGADLRGGRVRLPVGPGLGVTPDPAALGIPVFVAEGGSA